MRGLFRSAVWLLALLLAGALAEPAWAQRGPGQGKRPQRREEARPPAKQQGKGSAAPGKFRPQIPPPWMQRLQQMSPEDQERFLQNNRRFRNLPPEHQAEIRRRLQLWNSLPPEQQRAMRQRLHRLQQMSPQQRQQVREEILPRWRSLPPERRQALMRRLRVLRDLSEEERAVRLEDEEFLKGLNRQERDLLRQLAELRVGPPE